MSEPELVSKEPRSTAGAATSGWRPPRASAVVIAAAVLMVVAVVLLSVQPAGPFGRTDAPSLDELPVETATQAARSHIGSGIADGHGWMLRVAGDGGTEPTWHLTVDGRVAVTNSDRGASASGGDFRVEYFSKSTSEVEISVRHVTGMPSAASVRVFLDNFEHTTSAVLRLLNDTSDGWFVVTIGSKARPRVGMHVLDANGANLWQDTL